MSSSAGDPVPIDVPYTTESGRRVIDACALARHLEGLLGTHATADVAATAQATLADGLAAIAIEEAADRDLHAVGFTGGVAYNDAIFCRIRDRVESSGLRFLSPSAVPPGDAGISYGQAVVAAATM
ncbi:MAG: hypothetical protein ABEJ58_05340 [Halodesulfurarchaeum sp.]